jgi:excisionase family DNA binding protein
MARKDDGLNLTAQDVANSFADSIWAARFPTVLTIDQAAELLQLPKQTLYDWSSRGLLRTCCRKTGKHLRFFRDKLLFLVFNEGVNRHAK